MYSLNELYQLVSIGQYVIKNRNMNEYLRNKYKGMKVLITSYELFTCLLIDCVIFTKSWQLKILSENAKLGSSIVLKHLLGVGACDLLLMQ